MFEKMLDDKSVVKIEKGSWLIHTDYSDYNQCGSIGRNDIINRQDAVRLLGEMNIKLVNVYETAKQNNPEIAEELLQATSVLSYAMWGIKEIEPATSSNVSNTELCKL